ncbi:MAG TPA: succinate dehydrogenase assembly factor 2 [Hyphomicrobiales bacterium]|nr:succinate dehydrogenase assembly factor 2 [Hyphomicrobiales bacterium]
MSEDKDELRRKRLRFRAWHRGTREMDFILGNYADQALGTMTAGELDAFEQFLELPDQELFSWISGSKQAPGDADSRLLAELRKVHLTPPDYS